MTKAYIYYYNENKEQFKDEMIRAAHILVEEEEKGNSLTSHCQGVLEKEASL